MGFCLEQMEGVVGPFRNRLVVESSSAVVALAAASFVADLLVEAFAVVS
jgi:hypothetical protein